MSGDLNVTALARYARERRAELGLTQEELAAGGGPSTATIRLIEGGSTTSYRQKSLRELDTGLRWPPGTAHHILHGGAPPKVDGRGPVMAGQGEQERPRYRDPLLDEVAEKLASIGEGDVRFTSSEIDAQVAVAAAILRRRADRADQGTRSA